MSSVSAKGDSIWVSGDVGGLFMSPDNGVSWKHLEPKANTTSTHSNVVFVDPADGRRVVAGFENRGLRLTTDGGATWSTPTGFDTNTYPTAVAKLYDGKYIATTIKGVANPPTATSNADSFTVWRSSDLGASWSRVGAVYNSSGNTDDRWPNEIVPDPTTTKFYIITGEQAPSGSQGTRQALYLCSDGAATPLITLGTSGPAHYDSTKVTDLAVSDGTPWQFLTASDQDSLNSGSASQRIWKGVAGTSWTQVTAPSGFKGSCAIITKSDTTHTVVLVTIDGNSDGKVWKMAPTGSSFTAEDTTQASWGRGWIEKFDYRYTKCQRGNSRTITGLGGARLFWLSSHPSMSVDRGSVFNPIDTKYETGTYPGWKSTGIDNAVANAVTKRAGRLYIAFNDIGLFWSDDDIHFSQVTDSLRPSPGGYDHNRGECTDVVATDGQVWFAHSVKAGVDNMKLFYTNGAVTATRDTATGLPVVSQITDIAEDKVLNTSSNRRIYVCANGEVYKSGAGTSAFTKLTGAGTGKRFVSAHNGFVVAGGENGLRFSSDGGSTWSSDAATSLFPTGGSCSDCPQMTWVGVHDVDVSGSPSTYIFATVFGNGTSRGIYYADYTSGHDLTNAAYWTLARADSFAQKLFRWDASETVSCTIYFTSGRRWQSGGAIQDANGLMVQDGYSGVWYRPSEDGLPWNQYATALFVQPDTATYIAQPGHGVWKDVIDNTSCCWLDCGMALSPAIESDGRHRDEAVTLQEAASRKWTDLYDLQGRKVTHVTSRGVYFERKVVSGVIRKRVIIIR